MDSISVWHSLVIFVVVSAFLATLFAAFRMDGTLHIGEPGARPFVWGYWNGLVAVLEGALLAIMALIAVAHLVIATGDQRSETVLGSVVLLGIGMALVWSGSRVLQRRRWAWVMLTVISFNPILWLVNGVYGARRWQELAPETQH